MQITCPNCNKKFNVSDELIPRNGRLLQCGNCKNKWFHKNENLSIKKKQSSIIPLIKKVAEVEKVIDDNNITKKVNNITKTKVKEKKEIIIEKDKSLVTKKRSNTLKLFFVTIVSFTAFIVLIDTFKNQISLIFPDIIFVLNNLYESLKDIILFFKDLIK